MTIKTVNSNQNGENPPAHTLDVWLSFINPTSWYSNIQRQVHHCKNKHLSVWYCLLAVFLLTQALQAKTLVFPPYRHSYGIRKATPKHLFMFFGPRTFFSDPQGLATAKMISRDDTTTENDDDEVVVYGVNSGKHQLIYNTSMWALSLYGSKGSGKDEFNRPTGVACDPKGNVYVVDQGNNRIVQLFNPEKRVQWVRSFGNADGKSLSQPSHIALDEKGHVYVTDTGNRRIAVYDKNGTYLYQIHNPGGELFVDGPTTIAVADGSNKWSYFRGEKVIFCADKNGTRIWKLTFDGKLLKKIDVPQPHKDFYGAIDYYHNFWITDKMNHCLLKFDHNLVLLDVFGKKGEDDNEFIEPRGIAIWKRYGQTFIAEEKGAQYYWMGTELTHYSAEKTSKESITVQTTLKGYSYLSIIRKTENDTTILSGKRKLVFPHNQKTTFNHLPLKAFTGKVYLRVEPTYSSYTYNHWDYPLNF